MEKNELKEGIHRHLKQGKKKQVNVLKEKKRKLFATCSKTIRYKCQNSLSWKTKKLKSASRE